MEKAEIQALLTLAERIKKEIDRERDPNILKCLEDDLDKVKMGIGQRVFDLPLDVNIFDTNDSNSTIETNKSSFLDPFDTSALSLTTEKLDTDKLDLTATGQNENSPISSNQLSEKELAEKFSKFLISKRKTSNPPVHNTVINK